MSAPLVGALFYMPQKKQRTGETDMQKSTINRPNVRLVIGKEDYNALIQALENNAASEYDVPVREAEKLLDSIRKYARLRVSDDGMEYAELRFFNDEAAALIYQLIFQAGIRVCREDFYAGLKAEREAKKRGMGAIRYGV
jgi:hypothetical protein